MSRNRYACLAAALLALSGCVSSGVEVVPSTRPVRPGEYEVLGKTSGSSVAGYFYVLNFIPIRFGVVDSAGHARDEALAEVPGADALVDAVMDHTLYCLPIPVVHVLMTITDVEGTAVRTKPAGPAPAATTPEQPR